MRLIKATIEGYRSIKETVDVHLDPRVTIVLGANDHGKSNLLHALRHLNPEEGFDADDDLNWDCLEANDSLPRVEYELALDEPEIAELRESERLSREEAALVDFLEAAQRDFDEAEERAAPIRVEVDVATKALEDATEAIQEAKDAADASHEDASAAQAIPGVQQAEIDRRRQFDAARNALTHAEEELESELRKIALADARLIEVRTALRDEVVEGAISRELTAAEEAVLAGTETETAAATVASEATAAFEAGKAVHADGTAEYTQLRRAASTAETARKAAVQEAATRRNRLSRLKRAVEARDGLATQAPEWMIELPRVRPVPIGEVPKTFVLQRVGIAGELTLNGAGWGGPAMEAVVFRRLPRVELIRPVERVADSVTREQLDNDDAVFMRGIFHYAGLTPIEWDRVFTQDEVTVRRLADASNTLDEALRESWSQGSKLNFRLQHDSKTKRIQLWIVDPAVTSQWVRASRRSSGFTHFFALKTILHAHEKEAPASSYLWVFDEPGVYLHPDAQHDLVQVMETLAQSNQVIYSTHSIFMANKNFPTRHRLVLKTVSGTKIDGKPFRSRWRPAIEALGMSMPGTILFASRVLLVEGDSDSILINAILQKMLELSLFDRDVNSLGVMAAGDAADAAALVRILTESQTGPTVAALFDGDDAGEKRKRALERLSAEHDIDVKLLSPAGTTTEDHLPAALELYPRALAIYLAKMSPRRTESDEPLTTEDYLAEIGLRLEELDQTKEGLTKGMADWSRTVGKEIGQLEYKPSPSGVAREYALLLLAVDKDVLLKGQSLKRAREMAKAIAKTLSLPPLTLAEEAIFEEETFDADELA
jgi:predicted ATP-dependent endonuclease of OLD family